MATTDRRGAEHAPDPSAVADAIRESDLCHLLVRADADALAAGATLAHACEVTGVPYHAGVVRTKTDLAGRIDAADPGTTQIVLGATARDKLSIPGSPASTVAFAAALELDASPDPIVALAGVLAAGETPGETDLDLFDRVDLDRRPGIGMPSDDPVEGLAHTTLAHCEFSGDPDAARAAIDDLDLAARGDDANRKIASLLAISVASDPETTDRGATVVERALHPYATDGPFETLEGYADVLWALAHEAPGIGLALSLGTDCRDVALSAWREHAKRAHEAVRDARTARYDGLVVAHVDGPVETAARLLRDFRSPEPAVLAIDGERAGIAATDAVAEAFESAAERAGGPALASGRTGSARIEETERFVDELREEL